MNVLEEIIAHKKQEIALLKINRPLDETVTAINLYPTYKFSKALKKPQGIGIIAELKKASPSLGLIRSDFDPVKIARIYAQNGASAISVITDKKFFQGDINFIPQVKAAVNLPVLRKDFIIDPYQIYESKLYGADAILLIATVLSEDTLKALLELAHDLGLEALVEVHNQTDLQKAINAGARIIGINNRNLKTLKTDLNTSLDLIKLIPKGIIKVAESGIKSASDIVLLKKAGFDAVLIGTVLMQSSDIASKLQELANA